MDLQDVSLVNNGNAVRRADSKDFNSSKTKRSHRDQGMASVPKEQLLSEQQLPNKTTPGSSRAPIRGEPNLYSQIFLQDDSPHPTDADIQNQFSNLSNIKPMEQQDTFANIKTQLSKDNSAATLKT